MLSFFLSELLNLTDHSARQSRTRGCGGRRAPQSGHQSLNRMRGPAEARHGGGGGGGGATKGEKGAAWGRQASTHRGT